MRNRDYVAARAAREPRFESDRRVAAAELALAGAIAEHRRSRGADIEHLASVTGISAERLDAIEEGDTINLDEAIWLAHALGLSVTIDPEFRLAVLPAAPNQRSLLTGKNIVYSSTSGQVPAKPTGLPELVVISPGAAAEHAPAG